MNERRRRAQSACSRRGSSASGCGSRCDPRGGADRGPRAAIEVALPGFEAAADRRRGHGRARLVPDRARRGFWAWQVAPMEEALLERAHARARRRATRQEAEIVGLDRLRGLVGPLPMDDGTGSDGSRGAAPDDRRHGGVLSRWIGCLSRGDGRRSPTRVRSLGGSKEILDALGARVGARRDQRLDERGGRAARRRRRAAERELRDALRAARAIGERGEPRLGRRPCSPRRCSPAARYRGGRARRDERGGDRLRRRSHGADRLAPHARKAPPTLGAADEAEGVARDALAIVEPDATGLDLFTASAARARGRAALPQAAPTRPRVASGDAHQLYEAKGNVVAASAPAHSSTRGYEVGRRAARASPDRPAARAAARTASTPAVSRRGELASGMRTASPARSG